MLCLGILPLNRGGRSVLPRPHRQRPPAQRVRSAAKWSVGDLHVDAALGKPVGGWSIGRRRGLVDGARCTDDRHSRGAISIAGVQSPS
jgi:hypothetical protein